MRAIIGIIMMLTLLYADVFNISNRANIWIESNGLNKSYSKNGWSNSATINRNRVIVDGTNVTNLNDANGLVLINNSLNSYPQPSSSLPAVSMVGLSGANANLGDDFNSSFLTITPYGGDFDRTIEVSIVLNTQNNTQQSVFYKINNSALKSVTLPNSKGQKEIKFYLAKSGTYRVYYGFSANALNSVVFNLNIADKKADSDGDGIPDTVEAELGMNPFNAVLEDSNGNGWSDFDEFIRDNNITDSDGDGWSDFDEIHFRKTDPQSADICADADTIPKAFSLYGVEYNITATNFTNSINRVSSVNIDNNLLYDSYKIDANSLCVLNIVEYKNILNNKVIPHMRFNASKSAIVRVVSKENNKTKIYKKWLNAYKELSPKTFKNSAYFNALPNEMSAQDYKTAYINYLKDNLVKTISLNIDANDTIDVALIEASLKTRDDDNTTMLILGNPDNLKISKAVKNSYKSMLLYNLSFDNVFRDLKNYFSSLSIYTQALNKFNNFDNNITSEESVAKFLQTMQNEDNRYKLSLFTIVPKDIADNNSSLYNKDNDSDSDGLLNKTEVLSVNFSDPLNLDSDMDGLNDDEDLCVLDSQNSCLNENLINQDVDGDGIEDAIDNCPYVSNSDQNSTLINGIGDACINSTKVEIITPHLNKKVFKGESLTFEAVALSSVNVNSLVWKVEGVIFANKTLSASYSFNSEGTFEVCIEDSTNSAIRSCREIEVVKSQSQASDFEIYTLDVNENSGFALVEVKLDKPAFYDFNLTYNTQDISANSGSDYQLVSGVLNFNKGDIRKIIQIPIINDNTQEQNEEFKIIVANKFATVTIIDDDNIQTPTISVKIKEANRNDNLGIDELIEGNSEHNVTIEFSLSDAVTNNASFNFGVEVEPSNQYNSMVEEFNTTVTFNSGETKKEYKLLVYGDNISEYDREFKIKLTNPNGINFENNDSIYVYRVLLKDDDSNPQIYFENSSYEVAENGSVLIKVKLSERSYKKIEANITVLSASSADNSDYTITPISINILPTPPSSSSFNDSFDINVTAIKDSISEGNETLILGLKDVVNATYNNSYTAIAIKDFEIFKGVFLSYEDTQTGIEPWAVWPQNGYSVNLIKDVNVGVEPSEPEKFVVVNNKLYFIANDSSGLGLFESLGDSNSTRKVYSFSNLSKDNIYKLLNISNNLYVVIEKTINNTNNLILYRYENNDLINIATLAQNYILVAKLEAVNNKIYFIVFANSSSMNLYNYDIATDSLTLIENSVADTLAKGNGKIYYGANNGSTLKEVNGTASVNLHNFASNEAINNIIYGDGYLYIITYNQDTNSDTLYEYNLINNNLFAIDYPSAVISPLYYKNYLYYSNSNAIFRYQKASQNEANSIYTYQNGGGEYIKPVNDGIIFSDGNDLKSFVNGSIHTIQSGGNNFTYYDIIAKDINDNVIYVEGNNIYKTNGINKELLK